MDGKKELNHQNAIKNIYESIENNSSKLSKQFTKQEKISIFYVKK